MNVLSLLAFASGMVSLGMGIYLYRMDSRSILTRISLLITGLSAVWCFGYSFLISETDRSMMELWYRVALPGWVMPPSMMVHFSLVLTRGWRITGHPVAGTVIYLPMILFLVRGMTGTLVVADFIHGPYGTYEVMAVGTFWHAFYSVFSIGAFVFSCAVIYRWGKRSGRRKQKKQAETIFYTLALSLAMVTVLNGVIPQLGRRIPSLGCLLACVISYGIWRAISRYEFMVLTPGLAVSEIISKMMDLMFLVDRRGIIIQINPQVVQLLGYREGEVLHQPFERLTGGDLQVVEQMKLLREKPLYSARFITHLRRKNRDPLPVTVFCSNVQDKAGENSGAVVVAHDMRGTLMLEKEIGERRRAEEELGRVLQELEQERNNLKLRNEIMETELSIARTIQRQLIPAGNPLPNIASFYKPMNSVGGDFFDFIYPENSEKIGIFISDVSGHGVPAAFITAMIKSVILQVAPRYQSPAGFLNYLNRILFNQTNGNFVTAFYAIFDPRTRELVYANAGHHIPLVIDRKNGCRVDRRAMSDLNRSVPLAVMSQSELASFRRGYSDEKVQLDAGSWVLFYTDALVETTGRSGGLYGDDRLDDAVKSLCGVTPARFLDGLAEDLLQFHGNEIIEDDLCMICVELQP